MKLKDLGLTKQDIKDKVSKYMIETYERFDFLAETAEGMYMYDEKDPAVKQTERPKCTERFFV